MIKRMNLTNEKPKIKSNKLILKLRTKGAELEHWT